MPNFIILNDIRGGFFFCTGTFTSPPSLFGHSEIYDSYPCTTSNPFYYNSQPFPVLFSLQTVNPHMFKSTLPEFMNGNNEISSQECTSVKTILERCDICWIIGHTMLPSL
eukprot:TRINITY_DN20731_c0_g1_i1.p1 TRINITY_DN20731_c0_g1~~TRINITY_DN20731_c0_g1_i1.p1  ORF type:complete len:110 (+),score=3.67 TRINITY_DN20731_c0_g1_i1:38-367(+)